MSLVLETIAKRFGPLTAVDNVSLSAGEGEFVVLLGPSGCGKSTLLRIVAGLETPDAGAVWLHGHNITGLEPRDRDLAMVFQSYALYPHMSIAQNIAYPLKIRRQSSERIAAEVSRVAAKLGLDGLLDRRPRELSGGQRQRVALARAIVRKPKAFLMDEPLSNLDAQLRVETRAELKRLQHELNTVTLYVTHDQAEAMTLAHRIAVLHAGRLQQYDTPSVVYHRPANLFVAGFLGSPAMNCFEGSIECGAFVSSGLRAALTAQQLVALRERPRITLGVRPEDVEIGDCGEAGQTGRVYVAEEMGNETFVRLSAGGALITARIAADRQLNFDEQVRFRFRQDKLHFFDTSTTEAIR